MKKIQSLTPDQISLFPEYVKKWTAIGLSTEPANRTRAEKGVRLAYQIGGIKPPKIVWCGSPMSNTLVKTCVEKILKEKQINVRDSVGDSVRASVGDSVRASVGDSVRASVRDSVVDSVRDSVRDSVGASVWDSVWVSVRASVWVSVRDSVRASVWISVRDSVRDLVRDSVRDSVWVSVWDSVRDSVGASVWDSVGASVWASVWISVRDSVVDSGYGQHDANWIAFYHFFREIFNLTGETNKIIGLSEICQSAGWYLPYEKICWISERHNIVRRDQQGRLHFDGGPSVQYPDGWSIYAWHGTRIPEEWGSIRSETWKPEWLLETKNAEQRRVLLQGIGYDRTMKALNTTVIHTEKEMELRRINHDIDVEPIVLLKVQCPSTASNYVLRVPPEMKDCETARRWTLSNEPLELIQET